MLLFALIASSLMAIAMSGLFANANGLAQMPSKFCLSD